MKMKKLFGKTPIRTLTVELAEVKGGTTPPVDPNPPLDDPDCRTHIIDLG
jgi:hypothetical protein